MPLDTQAISETAMMHIILCKQYSRAPVSADSVAVVYRGLEKTGKLNK
jgi:hypothetical protein